MPRAPGWRSVAAATKAIEIVAADSGVALETDAALNDRAEAAVRAVELELQAMKARGELRQVNRAYREQRLARERLGNRAQPYGAWFANYKVGLVRLAAASNPIWGAHSTLSLDPNQPQASTQRPQTSAVAIWPKRTSLPALD